MEQYDGIIFDVDGTIWDAREVIYLSWKEAIEKHTNWKVHFDAEELGSQFGKTMDDIFAYLYPDMTKEELVELIPYFYEYEHRFLREMKPKPYDGLEEVLAELKKKYPLYIVTNAQKGYVEAMFDATGLKPYFTDWMCYGDTLEPKNVTMKLLVEKHGLTRPVYIGDTQGDANACELAGIPMIYAAYGLGNVEHPWKTINRPKELLTLLA